MNAIFYPGPLRLGDCVLFDLELRAVYAQRGELDVRIAIGTRCKRGLNCNFKHAISRQSRCTRFNAGCCYKDTATCPYSHNFTPETICNMSSVINTNSVSLGHHPRYSTYTSYRHTQPYFDNRPSVQNNIQMGVRNFPGDPKWYHNSFTGTDARELTSAAHSVPKINTFKKYHGNMLPESFKQERQQQETTREDKKNILSKNQDVTTLPNNDVEVKCAKLRKIIIAQRKEKQRAIKLGLAKTMQLQNEEINKVPEVIKIFEPREGIQRSMVPETESNCQEESSEKRADTYNTPTPCSRTSSTSSNSSILTVGILPASPSSTSDCASAGSKRKLNFDSEFGTIPKKAKVENNWDYLEDIVDWGSDIEDE
ncbi:hypothetical protein EDC01DRAFT_765333 [Geopyxis carbonaria]|nr:hypothetical protein EDC01DRAFT_765333 [Geopyxis carbonaria]